MSSENILRGRHSDTREKEKTYYQRYIVLDMSTCDTDSTRHRKRDLQYRACANSYEVRISVTTDWAVVPVRTRYGSLRPISINFKGTTRTMRDNTSKRSRILWAQHGQREASTRVQHRNTHVCMVGGGRSLRARHTVLGPRWTRRELFVWKRFSLKPM